MTLEELKQKAIDLLAEQLTNRTVEAPVAQLAVTILQLPQWS